ncbi:adenylate/guanylate cyclase domain-containing protein [Microvirga sp. ACRRW]|uniref:adenylate/guanylate cyclase domain-containing protein n=1 Tax=Microvirga sp. ACRRW TaxID=2918205 RepID=UPI001EF5FE8B|nr:adenylate/guanylate cyclase domain-containing protein [Microvirga sp. ACRRW]MCG7393063.1 adenylate/guanylate cyclase domain-containing protein [Microvirga sp. ACRRW]
MRRRTATILASDVVSFSRLVAEDEEGTLRRLTAYHRACETFIARHGGKIFNTAGDSIMCEFETPLKAVRAAIDIQEAIRARNLSHPPQRWLQLRIGISMGEVTERNGDLLGMAVNLAARLENLAKPGGVCVSQAVHEVVAGEVSVPFIDLGERAVKNIPAPIHTFAIAWPGTEIEAEAARPIPGMNRKAALWFGGACLAAILLAGAGLIGRHLALPAEPQIASVANPSPAQQVAQGLVLSTNPAETFSKISQKGGLIEDSKSAPGLYYKALLFEAKGEISGAHRAYYNFARMGLEFIDPHLRYAALVREHEGPAMARQVYAELHEDAPTRATALLHALQFDAVERDARLKALVKEHPDFAPAHYFLAEEHSEERLGVWYSPRDRRIELASLAAFLKAYQEGRLDDFFLDHAVVTDWVDRARKKRDQLEGQQKSASAELFKLFE